MSAALISFFEFIKAEADLQRFVSEAREEDLHLEFKEMVRRDTGVLDDGDKAAFSKRTGIASGHKSHGTRYGSRDNSGDAQGRFARPLAYTE